MKSRVKLVLLVALMICVSLLTSSGTSQAAPICQLDDCNDYCDQVCAPYGGTPWTCQRNNISGTCYGICYCY